MAPGRGILAVDESTATISKRFDALGVKSTPDNRRDYREMLFRSTEAMSKYISGVILYDETIRQNAKDGTPLVKLIEKAGSIPGIKVDKGTKPLPSCPGEVITEGLDGLGERLAEYRGTRRQNSPSGAPSSTSGRSTGCRATLASMRTRTRSRAMRRSARTRTSCRSSSPRC